MLSSFDVFVAASAQETFGLSVLEALGNGLPVLYTTCPALDGIVTDRARQVVGEVIALRHELAAEVDPPARARIPAAALLERYGIESISARIDGLYEKLLNRKPAQGRTAAPSERRDGDLSPSRTQTDPPGSTW